MGMFDLVKCEYLLDKEHIQNEQFQTKDLDCLLEQYLITEDGKLFKTVKAGKGWHFETLEEPEFMNQFTGEIRFYAMRTRNYSGRRRVSWYEYSAYFKDGILEQLNANHEKYWAN